MKKFALIALMCVSTSVFAATDFNTLLKKAKQGMRWHNVMWDIATLMVSVYRKMKQKLCIGGKKGQNKVFDYYNLGLAYDTGRGVRQNYQEAMK